MRCLPSRSEKLSPYDLHNSIDTYSGEEDTVNKYDMASAIWMINQREAFVERMKYEYVLTPKVSFSFKTEEEDS